MMEHPLNIFGAWPAFQSSVESFNGAPVQFAVGSDGWKRQMGIGTSSGQPSAAPAPPPAPPKPQWAFKPNPLDQIPQWANGMPPQSANPNPWLRVPPRLPMNNALGSLGLSASLGQWGL